MNCRKASDNLISRKLESPKRKRDQKKKKNPKNQTSEEIMTKNFKTDGNYELTNKRSPTNLKQKKHKETYTKVQQNVQKQ